jgi:hypothetical protein
MAVLNHLYRSLKISSYEDNYGGNVFDIYYYSYLLLQNNLIYIFSSSPMFSSSKLKPINSFDDYKTIKSIDIILKNASHAVYIKNSKVEITFELPVQVANLQGEIIEINRIYSAVLKNDGKFLKLKAFNDNNPDVFVIDSEFEKIDFKAPRSAKSPDFEDN